MNRGFQTPFIITVFCGVTFAIAAYVPAQDSPSAVQEYDWTTSAATGDVVKRDRLVFYNNRWAGEKGSIFVKYGPPACTWWTTHEGPVDPTFPVSAPLVAFGDFWGNVSEDSPLPIRLRDLEVLKASLSATLPGGGRGRLAKDMRAKQGPKVVPAGSGHMYRVCWQLYFSDSPTGAKYNKGDFAPTVFAVNCHRTWWGADAGNCESQGRKWKMCDCKESSGMGRYIVPLLDPYLTPDAAGKIDIRDVDIKLMIDWCIGKGLYRPDDYLVSASAAWEVWILDQNLTMNDMCFVIKAKGKPEVTVPSWSRLPSKSRSPQESVPAATAQQDVSNLKARADAIVEKGRQLTSRRLRSELEKALNQARSAADSGDPAAADRIIRRIEAELARLGATSRPAGGTGN